MYTSRRRCRRLFMVDDDKRQTNKPNTSKNVDKLLQIVNDYLLAYKRFSPLKPPVDDDDGA